MNEQAARNVVLIRAIETTDRRREILTDDDRMHADRTATELAQWQASGSKSAATADQFLQQRAELMLRKIVERTPSFALFTKQRSGGAWIAVLLPLLALLAGAGLDRISDPHRVDLLSAPLLGILAWNLFVYAVMLVLLFIPAGRLRWKRSGLLKLSGVGKAALPRKLPQTLAIALLAFVDEWARLSSKLTSARLQRLMHLSAALFALGAICSLYARGLMTQYAAGWESTFLSATQVHALLNFIFTPATWAFQFSGFTLAEIDALRFTAQSPSAAGGARWVHLYAATLMLLVVAPRLIFAAIAHWRAKHLAAHFPLDLQTPYFRQFKQATGGEPGILRVLPYSFTVDEARDKGLTAIATTLLGRHARVMLRPSCAYGEDVPPALHGVDLADAGVTLSAVLFSLAATPENENHGAFLDYLVRASPRGIAVLIDESGYRERTADTTRVAERIALWEEFCKFHGAPATVVNLLDPSVHPLDVNVGLTHSAAP
jgi:hypothetical protein